MRKKGVPVKQIAAREGVSERTVAYAISGKAFQKSLAIERIKNGNLSMQNAGRTVRVMSKLLTEVERRVDDEKFLKKMKISPKDLADLAKVSHLQQEQANELLKDAIKGGQEQLDEELKRDSAILNVTPKHEEEEAHAGST